MIVAWGFGVIVNCFSMATINQALKNNSIDFYTVSIVGVFRGVNQICLKEKAPVPHRRWTGQADKKCIILLDSMLTLYPRIYKNQTMAMAFPLTETGVKTSVVLSRTETFSTVLASIASTSVQSANAWLQPWGAPPGGSGFKAKCSQGQLITMMPHFTHLTLKHNT